jgi:site-specific DNA recombinase
LPDQEARIREYCHRNNLYLKEVYRDDGECSETFDRPDYLALENFIKIHRGEVQYLIVLDHDRFSRNAGEALLKIAELQKRFGVKVLSVAEPLNLDTTDPNVFLSRAFKYVFANHELLNIRKRTARGIKNAMESGRVVNNAPFGYINSRDEHNRPILKVDIAKAETVKKIFDQFISGVSLPLLKKNATKMGCYRPGHSSMIKLLNNPLYAGLIRLPAYEGKPERIIKALHHPIVSESCYWLAQEILNRRSGKRMHPKADFPLRGIVRCDCGAHLTAAYSKGKKKYYMYYQCVNERGRNHRGEVMHEKIEEILRLLSFSDGQILKISGYAKEELSNSLKFKTELLKSRQKEFQDISLKIERLELKMINDEIEASTYKVWFTKLNSQKAVLENEIIELKKNNKNIFDRLDEAIPVLTNLRNLYVSISLEGKQMLLNKVFEVGIRYDGKVFRTPMINPGLISNYMSIKEKGLLIVEQPDEFLMNSYSCTA